MSDATHTATQEKVAHFLCDLFTDDWRDGKSFHHANAATLLEIIGHSEMYAVLQSAPDMTNYYGHSGFEPERFRADYVEWRKQARTILAKAEGRTP